jgi:hypothetical protein
VVQHALGKHTTISRIQGAKLKTKREIRVTNLCTKVPAEFLKMTVVHELAHLRQHNHDKESYQLCTYTEPVCRSIIAIIGCLGCFTLIFVLVGFFVFIAIGILHLVYCQLQR